MRTPEKTFRVIVGGVVRAEQSRGEVVDKLAALFHSQSETMEQLLQGKETPLTKSYSQPEAEKICAAIRDAGAECRMEEIVTASPPQDDGDEHRDDDGDEHRDEDGDEHHDEDGGEHRDEDGDEHRDKKNNVHPALLKFVSVNTDYYARQFAKFGDIKNPSFAFTWHWPALFVFLPWALYRKLWWLVAVHFVIFVALRYFPNPVLLFFVCVFWPLTANYFYFRHARRKVLDALGDGDGDGNSDTNAGLKLTGGGVSRGAVFGLIAALILMPVLFRDQLTEFMFVLHSERVGEFTEPGSLQRGDGTVIDDLASVPPKVASTVHRLGALTVLAKLSALDRGVNDPEPALLLLQQLVRREKLKDAWGGAIILRTEAGGDAVLVSAGPDGAFNNADDVLQYIRLPAKLLP